MTFSFQEENGLVNTHSQVGSPSRSFSNLPACAKMEVKNALDDWSAVTNIEFEEMPENSDSDIRLFVADIRQGGIGYPNYPEAPCSSIGGHLILRTNLRLTDCKALRNLFLHEIGHVLGLGHVNTTNIMHSKFSEFEKLDGLQRGDRQGIIQLYGEKE